MELFSIGLTDEGERIWIEVNPADDNRVVNIKRHFPEFDFVVSDPDKYSHVAVTGVEPHQTGQKLLFNNVEARPQPYPKSAVLKLSVYQKNNDDFWAIGKDITGQAWAFFTKPKVFGDYWIATQLNASKTENERIMEKLDKGYFEVGDSSKNRFDPDSREVKIR